VNAKTPSIYSFPPTTPEELRIAGWDCADVIIISGDAYVDHPAFGPAVIVRILQAAGFKVAVIPQPDWKTVSPFKSMGKPRLFFGITGGNVDSMVANYTSFKNRRKKDSYSPGGKPGARPNRASIVYANRAKEAFPDAPIVLGGLEASMRRLSHYDFWEDKIRRSLILDAKADLLLYGMAEQNVVQLARLLDEGEPISKIRSIPGSVFVASKNDEIPELQLLPSLEDVQKNPKDFTLSFRRRCESADPYKAMTIGEAYGDRVVVQTPPLKPLSSGTLDAIYELPFTRLPHPRYEKIPIPALSTVETSIVTHRGCFGGCTFCSIGFHQGKIIQSRSKKSIKREVGAIMDTPGFKGTLNDIGGPSANMYGFTCKNAKAEKRCKRSSCLSPKKCPNLIDGHRSSVNLLKMIRNTTGVKRAFVQSGVRYDLCLEKEGLNYLKAIVENHISGTMKVAPEHSEKHVLEAMGKPSFEQYEKFRRIFFKLNNQSGLKQFLVNYIISAHPGCTETDMHSLKRKLDKIGINPEQIQDFIPLPGTAGSVMYYTGLNPSNDKPLYVARTDKERKKQRTILQPKKPGSK